MRKILPLILIFTLSSVLLAQDNFCKNKIVNDSEKPDSPNFPKNSSGQPPQTSTYVRPDAKTRLKRYFTSTFGVSALISSGAGAAFSQITNSPKEWNRTAQGFGRRFASSYGKGVIGKTITFGLNEAFKLDNHFKKSGQKGFGKRVKHVLVGSFTTRTKNGGYIPDFPHFIGSYSSNIIAKETWYPAQYDYKDGLKSASVSVFTRVGINLVREFIFK